MRRVVASAAAVVLSGLLQVSSAAAQGESQPTPPLRADTLRGSLAASAAVAPDTVTVGDHFRALLRIETPAGATVRFPQFNLVEPVEAVDSVRVARDSTGAWIATYRLVAWTTSDSLVASFPFRLRTADGISEDYRIRLTLPHVRSVLPADSSLHLPKPAKAVIPIAVTGPTTRGWLPAAALLLALLAAIVWLALRRRDPGASQPVDPRTEALTRLDEIEGEGLLERGEVHEYHVRTSRVLRVYLAAQGGWGEDLTTTEIVSSLRAVQPEEGLTRELDRLLRQADRVKFSGANAGPHGGGAEAFGAAVRNWIIAWPATDPGALGRAEAA